MYPKWVALANGTKDQNLRSTGGYFFDPYPCKSKFVKWVADLFQRGMGFGKIYDFKWFDTAPWLIVFSVSLLFFRG